MFIRLHHNKSYQKRGQVKRSAGKSSRKKNSTSNFFLFPSVHFIWRSPVLRSGFVSLGYIVPGYEQKKNSTKIRNEWHTKKERAKREKKENTSCSHARKSPIAIGYGFYFYRLSKIPSTGVGALARVSCVYQCTSTCTVCLCWHKREYGGCGVCDNVRLSLCLTLLYICTTPSPRRGYFSS